MCPLKIPTSLISRVIRFNKLEKELSFTVVVIFTFDKAFYNLHIFVIKETIVDRSFFSKRVSSPDVRKTHSIRRWNESSTYKSVQRSRCTCLRAFYRAKRTALGGESRISNRRKFLAHSRGF